ncbi:MAG: helix-turn-helix transcriptional regulator [Myxococcota bacterium]
MPEIVSLFTDRSGFAPHWRSVLERHGLGARLCDPEELGTISLKGTAAVFDASCEAYDDDELLTAVGFVRAAGGRPIVHVEGAETIEEVVEEICQGRIARDSEDVDRIAATLSRAGDRTRARRFEFVTVSPRDGEILVILADGHSTLLKRPLGEGDDESEIVAITLADDASSATLELTTGTTLVLEAQGLAGHGDGGRGASIPIDGARLGARLRELRLEAGLTQAELARRTGIHRPNIARVEAGRHTPSLETLARLAAAIGVPTTRVLSED